MNVDKTYFGWVACVACGETHDPQKVVATRKTWTCPSCSTVQRQPVFRKAKAEPKRDGALRKGDKVEVAVDAVFYRQSRPSLGWWVSPVRAVTRLEAVVARTIAAAKNRPGLVIVQLVHPARVYSEPGEPTQRDVAGDQYGIPGAFVKRRKS